MKPTACKKVLKELRDLQLQRRKAKSSIYSKKTEADSENEIS